MGLPSIEALSAMNGTRIQQGAGHSPVAGMTSPSFIPAGVPGSADMTSTTSASTQGAGNAPAVSLVGIIVALVVIRVLIDRGARVE